MAMPVSIPVIDVGPLIRKVGCEDMQEDPAVVQVVRELDEACRRIGFFYLKGHGVSVELMQGVLDVSREFFSLPDEKKMKIKMSGSSKYRGYQKVGENVTKGRPDFHEAIDLFSELDAAASARAPDHPAFGLNQWPDEPANFRPVMEEYLHALKGLGRSIMQGIALALGGPPDTFEGDRAGDPFWVFRVIGYPPVEAIEGEDVGIGCGEHTDYGLLTFVNQDSDVTALQVKTEGGEWLWAHPIPGTFVVNLGDMLKIWSNGLYQSTLHRVMNKNSKYRVSVPFFYEPNFEAYVKPLDFCLNPSSKSISPVVYGDHFTRKVSTNFVQ